MDALDEFRSLVLRHAPGDSRPPILEGVNIAASPSPSRPTASFAYPSFTVVGGGVKRTLLNGVPYDYRAGQYLVVSVELPVTGHILEASSSEPFVAFSMRLNPPEIAALLLEAPPLRTTQRPFLGLTVSDTGLELLDSIVRLLRLLDDRGDAGVLAPMYQREILWRLITGEQGGAVRQIGLADGRLSQVSRATRWIRDHFAAPLRIDELAAIASMSPSSLHRHFRAVTSMTPIQFQKQIRLQEARNHLLTDAQSVAEISYLVGYASVSQFNREYRRMYGLTPTADMGRGTGSDTAKGLGSDLGRFDPGDAPAIDL